MTFETCLLSKPQRALGLDNLTGLICSLSHTQRAIDMSINEYPVAPVSNNAVVSILLLFPSIHKVTMDSSVKKLPSKLDDDTINCFSPLFTTLTEVKHFPLVQRLTLGHPLD